MTRAGHATHAAGPGLDAYPAAATLTATRRVFFMITAVGWLRVGVVLPFTVLVMQQRGLSLGLIGLVLGLYGATVALLELPTGGLADILGRRPVLAASSALDLAGLGVFALAHSTGGFAAAWVLLGTARALGSGPLEAWFVDRSLEADPTFDLRGGLSRAAAIANTALATGAILGGALPALGPHPRVTASTSLGSLTVVLVAAMVLQVLHLAAVTALVAERSRRRETGVLWSTLRSVPEAVTASVRLASRRPSLRALLIAAAIAGFAVLALESLWQPRFSDLLGGADGHTFTFGVLLAAAFGASAAGAAVAPLAARALGDRTTWTAAALSLATAGAIVCLALMTGVASAAAAYVAVYAGLGAAGPLHMELLHRQTPSETRATMVSADSLALQAGGLLASLCLPRLAESAGIPLAWGVAGAVMALGSVSYLALGVSPLPRRRRSHSRPPTEKTYPEIGIAGPHKP